ncbi:MAG: hypothetical protein ACK5Q5_21730 [Planctomycetaceae bacterium]
MRMPFAKRAVAGLLTLLTASSVATAQSGRASVGPTDLGEPQWATAPAGPMGMPPGGSGGYDAGPIGVPGAMFQPQYSAMPPQALYPPNAPNTMNPWPEVSPFHPPNVAHTQHVNKNGLWFKEAVHRQTDYEFGIEYIMTSFAKPSDRLVGSNFQPLVTNASNQPQRVGPPIYTYGLGPQQTIDTANNYFPGSYPFPSNLTAFTLGTTTTPPTFTRTYIEDGNLYPIHTLGALSGGLNSDGTRLRWGMMHEDGTGWGLNGFYAMEADSGFRRGIDNIYGTPITQNMLLNGNDQLISVFNGSLPLIYSNDAFGGDHISGFLGEAQKFDLLYELSYNTTAAGAEANRFTGILHQGESTRVTSYVGARYMYLDEHFGFHGIDSGFGYDIILNTTGGNNTSVDIDYGRPDSGTILVDYPLLHAYLNSDVTSHMAGPQTGFRIDLGHKGAFHVWTMTTGGLLANYEQLRITGDNIGTPGFGLHPEMHDGIPTDPPVANGQFLDNSFRDKENHMHVSPMFEQSIYADIRLQNVMPFLKKSYLLEEAKFRIGYTYTWVGLVSRPGSSINWVGFPKYPSVKINRESFSMNQLNVGLTFPY